MIGFADDDLTGSALRYGLATSRSVERDGTEGRVQLQAQGSLLPSRARVYLMIDTIPAAVNEMNF